MCLPDSIWSVVVASLLKDFLGIAMESGIGLVALKACEMMSRFMLDCSGAIALMRKEDRPRKISSDEVIVVPLTGVYIAGQVPGSSVFPFQKVNTRM